MKSAPGVTTLGPRSSTAGPGVRPCPSRTGESVRIAVKKPARTSRPESAISRFRGHIDELFASDKQLQVILEQAARLGAQLLMQAAFEAEITKFPGRPVPGHVRRPCLPVS
jgi:hypothetical protein